MSLPSRSSFLKKILNELIIEIDSIYNVMLVSSVQQGDSDIYIHIYTYILHILFYYSLLLDIEYSSLCYTVGPCLSVLYVVVCMCYSQTPNLSLPPIPFGNHKFVLSVSLFLTDSQTKRT